MGKAFFPELPLGGLDPRPDRAALHPQYLRLFGMIPPEQAVTVNPTSLRDDGTYDALPALCDPTQAARHPLCSSSAAVAHPELYQLLAATDHPSAAALTSIADLRAWHVSKGHVPADDAQHGPLYFKIKSDNAWRDALRARSPEQRRKLLIIAVSILIAMIDAEDFTARQQEPQDAPDER